MTIGTAVERVEAAGPATPAAAKAEKVTSRPDAVSAGVTARAQGSRVEVESLREETSTTWVNPDGTFTTQQHQGPIRFRDGKGAWRDVDLDLVELADGGVAPTGHPVGLSLAGPGKGAGGTAKSATETDLALVDERGTQARQVVLAWPGALGKPALQGTTATYPEVQPGVDLVVESRRTGFEQHLVVKTAQALAALQGQSGDGAVAWSLPVKTKGLTARAEKDGSVAFVDAKGKVASRFAAPVAWDAEVDQRSGNRVNESPVKMTVAQQGKGRAVLTLTPDQDWLTDPARKFPITIDPTYASATATASFDTYVSSAYPTATYSTSTELRVGTYDGGGDKYRSFLSFPITAIHGKQIKSASLSLYEFHSWSCTAKTFYVHNAYAASSTTNWSNQPSAPTQYGSLSVAKGFSSSCAAGRVSVPVTSLVQAWSINAASVGPIRLHASESDNYAWKKFYSLESAQDPYVTYTYNRKPNLAAAPTLQAPPGTSYTPPGATTPMLFTTDSTPTLSTTISDPDGNGVYSNIEVHSSTSGSAMVAECMTPQGPYAPSGGTASCTLPTALVNNGTFYMRASAGDDQGLGNGGWSAWTKFYTAYNTPPTPSISCPGYANGTWTDTAPTSDVTCTITAAGITGDYATPGYLDLTVDGVAKPRLKITPSNDANVAKTTITVAKTANGAHTVSAVAVARTLKLSTKATHSFGWGGASLTLPKAKTATSGKISVAAGGPPRGTSATVTGKIQWRIAGSGNEATGWTDGPAITVSSPNATDPVTASAGWDVRTAVREAGASADIPSRTPVLLDVQVCFSYAGVATPQCTWSQSPTSVTRVPHAFGGGYPVADAGPGQVALFTGEFNTSATDVSVPGYSGDLTISRSHTSFDGDGNLANWPSDPVTGVFGPGWTAALEGPEAGGAGLQVIDNTRLDGTIVLVDEEGGALVYQNPDQTRAYKTGTPYLPATTETVEAAADLTISGTIGASMSLTLKEEDGTVTTWQPVAYSAGADTDWKPVSVNEPGQVGTTSYGHDATGRVTRIVAAVPPNGATPAGPAISCPTTGTLAKGCRAMDIGYATATTATSSTPGDYAGRVKTISATLWDPAAATMTSTTVARYQYDTSGRLVKVTDPRTDLGTEYTWDGTSTRIASVKQTGLAAHRLAYDLTEPTLPKVSAVTRDAPAAGGNPVTLARYAYGVALSGTGLPDLTDTAVDDWGQAKAPATGYAVFGPEYTGPVTGTGVDWTYADLQYADDLGYTVNTAAYGAGAWQLTATDYDTKGNTVRELDAGAIATVRAAAAAGEPLGAGQVDALSTQTLYNLDLTNTLGAVVTPAGTLVTDTYGPARHAALADGTVLPVRPHTHTEYDQGAPNQTNGVGINPANGEPYRLPTTITTGVHEAAAAIETDGSPPPDIETISTTVNGYAKLNATDETEGNPWALGTPTAVTSGGITRTTRYDTEGRSTETRQPLSDGADAGTTRTLYYTAGDHPVDNGRCGNKPEWAGRTCRTYLAAVPTSGPSMPERAFTKYSLMLQPETVLEASGEAARTIEMRYDASGRMTKSWTTSTIPGSTSRPGTYFSYQPENGLPNHAGELLPDMSGAHSERRTSAVYDLWGRVLSTTNDLGDVTTTGYDVAGRVATITEDPAAEGQPNSTTAYGYDGDGLPEGKDADGNLERRGLPTSLTISRAGAAGSLVFSAAYDADGKLTTQKLPGAITQRSGYDEAGEPKTLTYTGQVTPVTESTDPDTGETVYTPGTPVQNQPWLAWTVTNDATGRVRHEYTGPGAAFDGVPGVTNPADITAPAVGEAISYDRAYGYDTAGRLTTVTDRTATGYAAGDGPMPCTVRSYGFDANGRRTSLTSVEHPDGDCASTTGTTTTTKDFDHYDTADRPTTGAGGAGAYVYDAFGRQTTIPAADAPDPAKGNITLGYFDDDLPRSVTQDGTTTVFTLDSAGRRLRAETTTGAATSTLVRHYTDSGDNPSWTVTNPGTPGAVVTRYAESIGGDLGATIAADGATELTLANLHGDIVTTVPIPATQASSDPAAGTDGWSDYEEYGIRRPGSDAAVAGEIGYGWLGSKQRSATSETAGLTLMGRRLYNPATGRFTSPDPIAGGNENTYAYPNDPLNFEDISGCYIKCRGASYTTWQYQYSYSNQGSWHYVRIPNWYRAYSSWLATYWIEDLAYRWHARVTYYRRCYAGYSQTKRVTESWRKWREHWVYSFGRGPGTSYIDFHWYWSYRNTDKWTGTQIYWT